MNARKQLLGALSLAVVAFAVVAFPFVVLAQVAAVVPVVAPVVDQNIPPLTLAVASVLSLVTLVLGPKVPSLPTVPVKYRRLLVTVLGLVVTMLGAQYANAPWIHGLCGSIVAVSAALGVDIVAGPHPVPGAPT
jgi:hypothetical protein